MNRKDLSLVDGDSEESPHHEASIDAICAIQERLDYASQSVEFSRRQLRDGHPKAAAMLEQIAHANLREAMGMLREFMGNWQLLAGADGMEPLEFDRMIDDIAKGKRPQDMPTAWQ